MVILIVILLFLIVLAVAGRIVIYQEFKLIENKIKFCIEYSRKFSEVENDYFQKHVVMHEKYSWLTMNANKMQNILGRNGIIEYLAPYNQYLISNYHLVVNTIPKFKQAMLHTSETNMVTDSILRVVGSLNEEVETINKRLRNPLIWLQQGFKEFVSVPIYLLNWLGIISETKVGQAKESIAFKIIARISGLITFLVTVISGIATIIDSKATIKFFKEIFVK